MESLRQPCVWLVSHNVMYLRFIHGIGGVSSLLLFIAVWRCHSVSSWGNLVVPSCRPKMLSNRKCSLFDSHVDLSELAASKVKVDSFFSNFLLFIYFLAVPGSMRDPNSLTRDRTGVPCIARQILNP